MYFKPFDPLLPEPSLAAGLIAPPYDVMNTAEARGMVDGKPFSLLRVTRNGHQPRMVVPGKISARKWPINWPR